MKPHLKLENKLARLKFCMSMVDDNSISTSRAMLKPMTNMVHIDEKWFDMTRVKNSYYVLPGENERKELAREGKRKKSKGKGREEVARERKRM